MNRDFAFINFYKDLASAKQSDNPIIATKNYNGFIVLPTDKTICQITNSSFDIDFIGGILVELIDSCGNVISDISTNFYYSSFTDESGIKQIKFEFGYIGTDYYTDILYLKITDTVNGNAYYSNPFLITDIYNEQVVEFVYWSDKKINGISYDIANCKQRIFINNCYEQSTSNKKELKQYINSQGVNVNYRNIITFQRKYFIEFLDFFTNDRLEILFSHPIIYLNSERVTVNDFKAGDRLGDTNILKDNEFTVNKTGETYNYITQILEPLSVNFTVVNDNFEGTLNNFLSIINDTSNYYFIVFNKIIGYGVEINVNCKIYKDDELFKTITTASKDGTKLRLYLGTDLSDFTNGSYYVRIDAIENINGFESFQGFYGNSDWNFTILDGEFDGSEFDNDEFLTN